MIKYGALTLEDRDENGTLWVVSCEKDAKEVQIPRKVEGKIVVGIGEYAFQDCEELTRVDFPEGGMDAWIEDYRFDTIEDHAFTRCTSLVDVILPDTVFHVGHGAFLCCKSLIKVRIPMLCHLSPYAFARCPLLSDVNPTSSLSEGVFSECSSLTSYQIPSGTTVISEDAFDSCYGLKEIVIPKSVKQIEALAFRGCSSLRSVVFEDPEGWVVESSYFDEVKALDLSDPAENARDLSTMDFDDGILWWKKMK